MIAVRPSHAANCEFARLIVAQMNKPLRTAQAFGPPPVAEARTGTSQILQAGEQQKWGARSATIDGGGSLNIDQVMQILPHRYPFLMVDGVSKVEGNKITAFKNVTINEPYFQGQFPRSPDDAWRPATRGRRSGCRRRLVGRVGQCWADPRPLITQAVDESVLVTLAGNTRPEAVAANYRGVVADAMPLDHMMLQLRRAPEQEAAFEQRIAAMHDPASPLFHHWSSRRRSAPSSASPRPTSRR